uniref:Uncharacterized protein n=1 Tax=uncultured marine thaumarchaeote AD1000_71_D06 TaxID=1455937 RepID=A0A075G2L1_9ARCH|nr:hypothetical protein [uncultured marine thaumarchaeote AD1000_71_D06]
MDVEVKECIFNNLDEETIERISGCRIFDPKMPFREHLSSKQEIDFEKNVCEDTKLMEKTAMVENAERIEDVIMYDGFEVQNIIYDIITKMILPQITCILFLQID